MPSVPSTVEQLELEIEIAAPRERVWKALTENLALWWPKDFATSPKAKGFVLEPRLGGQLYEDWGNGAGVIWAQIFAMAPPDSLDFIGCMAVPYGPAHSMLHLELVERGESTVLKISDSTIGLVHDGGGSKEEGWKLIFDGGLKRFVESTVAV